MMVSILRITGWCIFGIQGIVEQTESLSKMIDISMVYF